MPRTKPSGFGRMSTPPLVTSRNSALALGILLWLSATPGNVSGQDFGAVCDEDDFVTGSFGNLVVPPGGQRQLLDAVIDGNIRAEEGAILGLLGGVTVKGNIAVYGSTSINILTNPGHSGNVIAGNVSSVGTKSQAAICGAAIGGDVLISAGFNFVSIGGTSGGAACQSLGGGNMLTGNVRIENNNAGVFRVADNVLLSGDLTISGNTGAATKRVLNNKVGKNLICTDNQKPLAIGGNSAAKSHGQCGR